MPSRAPQLEQEGLGRERQRRSERRAPASVRGTSITRWRSRRCPPRCATPPAPGVDAHASERQRIQTIAPARLEGRERDVDRATRPGPVPSVSVPVATRSSSSSGRRTSASTPSRQSTSTASFARAGAIGPSRAWARPARAWRPRRRACPRPMRRRTRTTETRSRPVADPRALATSCGSDGEVEADHGAAQPARGSVRREAQRELAERGSCRARARGAVALDARAEAGAPGLELQAAHERPRLAGPGAVADLDPSVTREPQPRQSRQVEVGAASLQSIRARRRSTGALELPVERQIAVPRAAAATSATRARARPRAAGGSSGRFGSVMRSRSISTSRLRPGRNEIARRSRRAGRAGARARPPRSRRWRM